MESVDRLKGRIDAEFNAALQRVHEFQQRKLDEYHLREQRLDLFAKVCDELRDVWKPRLKALAERFSERASVKPATTRGLRAATFQIHSPLAKVVLVFSATPDSEVRRLVLKYDLEILPILMKFKNSDELEMPLDAIDSEAVASWIDDRIVDFVKTYLELHENRQYLDYLKHYTVEDPIAGVRFPKYAAGAKCDWQGETRYFISDETCQEFLQREGGGQ